MADLTDEPIPLVLRLLDHQLVGPQDQLVGNIDDLEVREQDGRLAVTGLLSGPAAMALRQGGRTGRWMWAIWRRLHPQEDPRPAVIPLDQVRSVGSAVHVSDEAARVLVETAGLELWLRRYVISRIPGALAEGEEEQGGDSARHRRFHPELDASSQTRVLSDLLGVQVVSADGEPVGRVIEVVAEARERTGIAVGPLTVQAVVCSRRHQLGSRLGYTMTPQGPWLLQTLLRQLHRGDRLVRVEDFDELDWDSARVTLRHGVRPGHPHQVSR